MNGSADPAPNGSQTLSRGLDILEAVADGSTDIAALSAALGTSRSTTHRLASALAQRGYLYFTPRQGYRLGPRLLRLGVRAQGNLSLPNVARPFLERLSEACEDTIHLGILSEGWALYLDKLPGRRRIEISSRIGERHPVWSTGLGKALILDRSEAEWGRFYDDGVAGRATAVFTRDEWLQRMHGYAARGITFDLEENEALVRCVASPIRDAQGRIVAAFSVTSTAQYMNDDRMAALTADVLQVGRAISRALGWSANGAMSGST